MTTPSRLSLSSLWVCGWVFFGALLSGVLAYPSGADPSACTGMTPSHGSNSQSYTDPFTVTANSSTYSPNERIAVTIAVASAYTTDTNVFVRGFMLQARLDNNRNSNSLGTFLAGSDTKAMCTNGASTHTERLDRSSITVTWEAPDSSQGNIVFRATVVRVKNDYYTGVYSSTISPSPSTTPTSTTTTTTPTSTTTTTIITSTPTTTTTTSPSTTTTTTSQSTTSTTTSQSTTIVSSSTATNQTATASSTATTTQDERNTRPVGKGTLAHCNILAVLLMLLLSCLMPAM